MAGFGRSKFGKGPFGKSDTGRDLIIEIFPESYLEDDAAEGVDPKRNPSSELYKILHTYSNSVLQRRKDIETMPSLIDYEKASSDILLLLGDMLGLGIDKNDPLFLQRSFVGNASQWLQIKGSKRGYQVRGLASGFDVTVENYWRVDEVYKPLFPQRFRYNFKPESADPTAQKIFHTNKAPGEIFGTPTVEGPDYAKAAYLRVIFEIAEPRREGFDYNTLLDLVIDKIRDVVAIHHEITAPEFRITINVPVPVTAEIAEIHENIERYNFNEFDRFDIVPADSHPLDQGHIYSVKPIVQISVPGDGAFMPINVFTNLYTAKVEEFWSHTINVSPSASLIVGQEQYMEAYVQDYFDIEAIDNGPTDRHLWINMTIEMT